MPSPTPRIRIMIADDHAILRSGLKLLVNSQDDLEVVAEAADGQSPRSLVIELHHDSLLGLRAPSAFHDCAVHISLRYVAAVLGS